MSTNIAKHEVIKNNVLSIGTSLNKLITFIKNREVNQQGCRTAKC